MSNEPTYRQFVISDQDGEADAILVIARVLEGLDYFAQARIIEYFSSRIESEKDKPLTGRLS